MENIWIANFASSALVIGVFLWLGKRFIDKNEKRHEKHERKSGEIEHNYLTRFEKVNRNIQETRDEIRRSKDEIVHNLGTRIDKVNEEKHAYRIKQAEAMGEIKQSLRDITRELQNNRP